MKFDDKLHINAYKKVDVQRPIHFSIIWTSCKWSRTWKSCENQFLIILHNIKIRKNVSASVRRLFWMHKDVIYHQISSMSCDQISLALWTQIYYYIHIDLFYICQYDRWSKLLEKWKIWKSLKSTTTWKIMENYKNLVKSRKIEKSVDFDIGTTTS